MTNTSEKSEAKRLKDLQNLRDWGFHPWALVLFDEDNESKLGELVSYPFPTTTGYSVNMRTRIGDPTSMIEIATSDLLAAEELSVLAGDQQASDFLRLIAPILRNRRSC